MISKKASLKLNLNINDSFNFYVDAHDSIVFKGKIIEIVENENLVETIYTDYSQIIKYFKTWEGEKLSKPIYTNMLSKLTFDNNKASYQNYAISIRGNKKLNDSSNPFKINNFINDSTILQSFKNVSLLNENSLDIKHHLKELNSKAKIALLIH